MPLKVVVLGGTRGIGRALARRLAARGDSVHLLGRDPVELERGAADLAARMPATASVTSSLCDLEQPDTFAAALDAASTALGGFDTVVVTAGMFGTQGALEADAGFTQRLLTVNFAHTVLFCEHVRAYLVSRGGGTLCVFSSVAGDRGRKPVILYGASKAGVSAYLEGLDHKFRSAGLRVVCVKPGFVRTGMTEGLPEPPFAADPDQVAAVAVRAIDRGTPVVYAPPIWALVMLVIRWLPRAAMRRVGF
ncbi:MAG TPA: SDR family NAD(P)-dependent oxidoreductase [Vicinamibacterales bacterium]|nr:SDR family NAD(P)-dependent oxidoreductase [Vicinamibacterales bacterium]